METLFLLGPVAVSYFGVLAAFSFLVFSFVLWSCLKEDFEEEKILTLTILLVLAFLLGSRLLYILTHFSDFGISLSWFWWRSFPGFSFLGGILGLTAVLYWWTKKEKWDFWQVTDNTSVSLASWLPFFCLGILLSKKDSDSFFLFSLALLFAALVLIFFLSYRRFIWYKSGKPGFTACASLPLMALAFLLLEFLGDDVVFFFWEKIGFVLLAILGIFFLYFRSERVFRQDFLELVKFLRRISKKD